MYMELGNTGLDRAAGYVYEEQLTQLQGLKGIRTYKEMRDNDPTVGSILFAIEMLIRQVLWQVEPVSDSDKDTEAADFLDSCMNDMNQPWSELICEILSMLVFGWSYHELVYKRRLGPTADPKTHSRFNDGRIGWRKIPIRAQETLNEWEFDEAGDIIAMWQMGPPTYELVRIPMEKALLFRTVTRKGNPEGRSVLRNAYRPWYYKKNIESIEGIGIERDLAGLPVAWVPAELLDSTASAGDKAVLAEIKKIVRNIRRDEQEGIVFPLSYDENNNKIYDLTLLSTGGRRQFDTDTIVQRYDSRIAMTVLADFILLGTKNVGSFALSSSKTELFAVAIGAWLNSIADVFNRYAVPRLFELNSFSIEALPAIVPGDIESIPLEELGKYLSDLSGAGMPLFPNEELEKYLLKLANLPINK
jgi:hypothetical protein